MTLLWLFVLLWLLAWAVAQAFVPVAVGWLLRYPGGRSQPRRILLVCALPWLVPFTAIVAMADAIYQAGELSVMELLDAYRTELETWQQSIDSAQAARTTFIQLQQLEKQY